MNLRQILPVGPSRERTPEAERARWSGRRASALLAYVALLARRHSPRALRLTIMRALLFTCLLLVMLACTFADSCLLTLEQKVAASTAILRVSVAEVARSQTKNPIDPAVCKAKVLEVLKGPADLKAVEFRFAAYGSFSAARLPEMVAKEYYVFLHDPPPPRPTIP